MADSVITAIDRVFDLVDSVVDKADHALNRTKLTEEQHRARRAKIIDTAPAVKVATKETAPSTATGLVRRRFRIIEAIAAETGQTIFVVTDGGNARAECSTRELAEKILGMLETAP